MGMIEKRGKNSWRVGVQIQTESGRKWVRRTIKLPSEMSEARQYREAEKALARLVLSLDDEDFEPPRPRHTVRSFAELWMEQHVVPNLAAATQKNYRHFLDARILPALGDVPLEDLTPLRLTQWLNEVRRSPRISTALPEEQLKTPRRPSEEERMARAKPADMRLSARTVQHYYDTLEAMLKKAVQWDVLEKNPMEKVDRPVARKKKANYLTEERAVELLRCLREEPNICFRAALLLALLCGLRLGEVGALRLSDVDWERGTIDISRALKYTPQGTIAIEMDAARPDALVISDTGIGIRPEDLPRVFEKGYTGFNGREGDRRATGIGLYLCRRILKRLGHTIEIESSPGRGTRVILGLDSLDLEVE